ncbi:hypothetical protein BOX15_Mlig014353g3 [Macrostomum lignano]|uniref:Uncharacterized protein n=2 Tax=Macrostomum lignano TaxID=282301 RepID=A0A267F633_9PLAT|nr:hypothetical protein BOX15_Mlig014353g2 [Macrostomum lignano]PAA71300.1 hypothetical protein BOX15_Mlig014353g1 [Macrostomum lignano]PAA74058.1 hypothetical protein BOX15_Mlig014353g3 [Macrostomum lignano]
MNKSSYICLGLLVLASMIGAGQAIKCLVYSYSGITGGTPLALECGSSYSTCFKYSVTTTTAASSITFAESYTGTQYVGGCGTCSSLLPSSYGCSACASDQCNSAFGAVRAAVPLTLALPLLIAAMLRSF